MDIHENIKAAAMDVANKHGGRAYKDLCLKWGVEYVPEAERIFKAGMATGFQAGLEACLAANRERVEGTGDDG